ncbi:MAG: RidA family protein [Burkholderiales bacterium]
MKRRAINPAALSVPTGYSHVSTVTGGTSIYVSGQIAFNKEGQIVGLGDVGAQAKQVYENLGACLKAAGASFKDVVKLVSYVVNLTPEKATAVRAVRREYLGDAPFPASTMVGVTALVNPDLLIEVEVIAFVPDRPASKKKLAAKKKAPAKKASAKRRR